MPDSLDHIEIIARALITRPGSILLCKNLKNGYFYLPGGHVDPGEAASDACKRELQEELNLCAQVGKCRLITEQIFEQGGQSRHEISLVFHVEHLAVPTRDGHIRSANSIRPVDQSEANGPVDTAMSDDLRIESAEDHIGFEWVKIIDLNNTDLRPASIRDWIVDDEGTAGTRFLPG